MKQCCEHSHRFYFNSSEVKQRSERSHRFSILATYAWEIIFQCHGLMQRSKRSVMSQL